MVQLKLHSVSGFFLFWISEREAKLSTREKNCSGEPGQETKIEGLLCTQWERHDNGNKRRKHLNLHPSVAASRFAPSNRTNCSSTTWVSRNTHRSGLLRYAASLARTPRVPRPRAVYTTAMRVTRNSSVTLRRARCTTATRMSCDNKSLIHSSSTARPRTSTVCRPVVSAILPRATSPSPAAPGLRKVKQCTQKRRNNKKDDKKLLHAF